MQDQIISHTVRTLLLHQELEENMLKWLRSSNLSSWGISFNYIFTWLGWSVPWLYPSQNVPLIIVVFCSLDGSTQNMQLSHRFYMVELVECNFTIVLQLISSLAHLPFCCFSTGVRQWLHVKNREEVPAWSPEWPLRLVRGCTWSRGPPETSRYYTNSYKSSVTHLQVNNIKGEAKAVAPHFKKNWLLIKVVVKGTVKVQIWWRYKEKRFTDQFSCIL